VAAVSSGIISAWGSNYYGNLGNGTTDYPMTPVQATSVVGATSVAAGGRAGFMLKADATAWGWGYNQNGDLGLGITGVPAVVAPVQLANLDGVTALGAGDNATAAVRSDGTVWTWGPNGAGALGNGTCCASSPLPTAIAGLSGITAASGGGFHMLARKSDNTAWAWGSADNGRLGNGVCGAGGTSDQHAPVQVSVGAGLTSVTAVAAGWSHSLALKSDGTVWAFGGNLRGEVGDGTTIDRCSPVAVTGLTGVFTAIAAVGEHSMALRNDGTVWTWGINNEGEEGNGTTVTTGCLCTATPAQVTGITTATAIAQGSFFDMARKSDGTVWTWGSDGGAALGTSTLNFFNISASPVQVTGLTSISQIASGDFNPIARKSDGTIWIWGNEPNGQTGNGKVSSLTAPVAMSGLTTVTGFAGGHSFTTAVKADGTVWTWGYGFDGQAGNNTTVTTGCLCMTTPTQATITSVATVAAGAFHTLAIKTAGTLYSWGDNAQGQVSGSFTSPQPLPVQVTGFTGGTTVTAVAGGARHSIALLSNGAVWTWGENARGQLGRGTCCANQSAPGKVTALSGTFIAVGAGDQHSIAVRNDGTVWTWGRNDFGQLGDNTTTDRSAPVEVKDCSGGSCFLTGVTTVSTGPGYSEHVLARKSDGTVWSWGWNSNGQLGNGTSGNQSALPVQASGLTSMTKVAAGQYHSLGLKSDGTVWAWGSNTVGPVGQGTMEGNYSTPVQVLGASGATMIGTNNASSLSDAVPASGGALSLTLPQSVAAGAFTLNGANGSKSGQFVLEPFDERGTGVGWNVQVTSTTLTVAGHVLPTNATTITAATANVGEGTTVLPTNGVAYPFTLPAAASAPTAVKLFNAASATGKGGQLVTVTDTIAIPANAFAGTFASVWTFTIATGP
jgi:alpha-tubulin suppressor-like RCC1 family protein